MLMLGQKGFWPLITENRAKLITKNMLKCPRCLENQGYKQKIDFINYYNCPCCMFQCYMKHYRGELKKTYENKN